MSISYQFKTTKTIFCQKEKRFLKNKFPFFSYFRSELSRNRRASVQNYLDDFPPPNSSTPTFSPTSISSTPTFSPTPILSSFKSPTFQQPPAVPGGRPTPEEIERDVNIIFRNMGIDRSALYQIPWKKI